MSDGEQGILVYLCISGAVISWGNSDLFRVLNKTRREGKIVTRHIVDM
jgi:hypothetical protein